MLRTLRIIFEQQIANFADEPETRHSLELAGAALLMEISRADHDVSTVERDAIRAAIKKVFHLSDDEIEDIVSTAERAVETAVSLFDFTAVVNDRFNREQKVELVEMLWAVAYADRNLDHYEEYYVRKIADLLHVSHSDYIKTKHKVITD
ncbi:MAG: TerB family tellurite resistance protein [Gammaproteobacteria bacterium]|jgi:uncharacterized tellurite resistance protein B-like protein|nr:TerB family tellurite resistance protein [Gammaproteobacteria bacterium]